MVTAMLGELAAAGFLVGWDLGDLRWAPVLAALASILALAPGPRAAAVAGACHAAGTLAGIALFGALGLHDAGLPAMLLVRGPLPQIGAACTAALALGLAGLAWRAPGSARSPALLPLGAALLAVSAALLPSHPVQLFLLVDPARSGGAPVMVVAGLMIGIGGLLGPVPVGGLTIGSLLARGTDLRQGVVLRRALAVVGGLLGVATLAIVL